MENYIYTCSLYANIVLGICFVLSLVNIRKFNAVIKQTIIMAILSIFLFAAQQFFDPENTIKTPASICFLALCLSYPIWSKLNKQDFFSFVLIIITVVFSLYYQ